jgi:hypothetical protein
MSLNSAVGPPENPVSFRLISSVDKADRDLNGGAGLPLSGRLPGRGAAFRGGGLDATATRPAKERPLYRPSQVKMDFGSAAVIVGAPL